MKFKIDENLPGELAESLCAAGHDALTVLDQCLGGAPDEHVVEVCRNEERILVTLDLDFSDIRKYPPTERFGLIVLRPRAQDKQTVLATFSRIIPLLVREDPIGHLWVVDEKRIRIRKEES